jgi:hypothetical protein
MSEINAVARPAPPGPGAVIESRPPAAPPGGRPEIARALAAAQQRCRAVAHDAEVRYPGTRYNYASSEAVIEEAKHALAESGLSLLPVEQSVNGSGKDGSDRFELERKFLLLHSSGEFVPIVVRWPVCPEKGRPLDKATAAAATLSLAYLLRDMLLMPRVAAEDEVPARPEPPARPASPPARTGNGQPAPAAPPPDGQQPADPPRLNRLDTLVNELIATGVDAEAVAAKIEKLYGFRDRHLLTRGQADFLIGKLETWHASRDAATAKGDAPAAAGAAKSP